MNIIKGFKFRVSVSREGYENKETAKACLSREGAKSVGKSKMAFKEEEVTISEFLDYAISGYSFCNLFSFDANVKYWVKSGTRMCQTYPIYKRGINKGYFKLQFKSDEYFYGSQVIFVDIDFTKFTNIQDYIDCLTYKPTCVYMSFSDKADKGGVISRRFRLVYVFDNVLGSDEFKRCSEVLYRQIIVDTQEPMSDSCGMAYSQYMNGGNSSEVYMTDNIYSTFDFRTIDITEPSIIISEEDNTEEISFNSELVKDMNSLPYEFVVRKWYAKGLRYFTQTEVDFGGKFYATTTEDFVRLYWWKDKIKDGNERRKKLYYRASLRRLMKEDVSSDELLYNLYIDREKFFDNEDSALNIEVLMAKVKKALTTDIEEIKLHSSSVSRPKFVINPEVSNKREAIGNARKDITDSTIGELYDFNLTPSENKKEFDKYGIKISLSRIYKWCSSHSVSTKPELHIEYHPELSIRQNMKLNGCSSRQILKAKREYEANLKA